MLINHAKNKMNHLKDNMLFRHQKVISRAKNNCITINKKKYADFSSNDYLSLHHHPNITEAFTQATKTCGFGSGASALVSGYSEEHAETESLFAKWLNVDKAILFNSGYCANIGVISTLADRFHTVFSDKLCHASLLDGIRLSRSKHQRYKHCDIKHLDYLANNISPDLLITESVFSMEGSITPLFQLVEFSKNHQSGLLIDDAHGIGVLGKTGAGICEHFNINQNQFSCLTLPLGKAFNAMGAIVAGRSEILETILQFSPTYRYTTALPPVICKTLQTTIAIVQQESWRRNILNRNIKDFIDYAHTKKVPLVSEDITPIKSIVIGDYNKLLNLQSSLLSNGFYVAAIRPPTVPKNKSRLRISLNTSHTQNEIIHLIDIIAQELKL